MNFIDVLGRWVNRYFSRPDAIFLVAAILAVSAVLYVLAGALAPVLTGLVIAFLLQGLVERLRECWLSSAARHRHRHDRSSRQRFRHRVAGRAAGLAASVQPAGAGAVGHWYVA